MQVNFLVAGAQKGGTSALHAYLREQPDLCLAEPKMFATAVSAASRPAAMRTRPFMWASRVASNTIHSPPM